MDNGANPDRRRVLKSAAALGGLAALGGSYAIGANPPATTTTLSPATAMTGAADGWFDVTRFGAKGDGTSPDTGAISRAIDAAGQAGGGVVWFPAGTYLLDAKLIVAHQVTLVGTGWASRNLKQGSWILARQPGVNVEIRGQGTVVSGLGFIQEQPQPKNAKWQPRDHDFAIHAANDDIFLSHINLFNCTKGVRIRHFDGGNIGRVILDHIWGRPLQRGIEMDNCRDTVKVNNVHFWPFWEETSEVVAKWCGQNGEALSIFRADNPHFSNIFALGYNCGFVFRRSPAGITSKFLIVNADCDYCETAIAIRGAETSGMITNFQAQGAPGDIGIAISADRSTLMASNVRLTNYRGNAIRAGGQGTRVCVSNLWVQGWNASGKAFPAVEAENGATIHLGRPLMFDAGKGAPNWRRDGANGGRVLTGFDELVSEMT